MPIVEVLLQVKVGRKHEFGAIVRMMPLAMYYVNEAAARAETDLDIRGVNERVLDSWVGTQDEGKADSRGFDLNFGHEERRLLGCARIEAPQREIDDHRECRRKLDMSVFPGALVALWQDPSQDVPLERATATTYNTVAANYSDNRGYVS